MTKAPIILQGALNQSRGPLRSNKGYTKNLTGTCCHYPESRGDQTMQNLLRTPFLQNIFLASLAIAVLVPSLVIGYIYPKYNQVLIEITEAEAVRFTKHWASRLRGEHGAPETGLQEIASMAKSNGAVKLRIFSQWGDIIHSTDSKEIGIRNTKDYFHEIVAQGNVFSKVVNKNTPSAEGTPIPMDVVEVYVPIMQGDTFKGALEIYYNITSPRKKLNAITAASSWLLIALVLVLEGAVVYLLYKAGNIFACRKETERQLLYEKEFGDAVFHSISDPIAVIDPLTYKVVKANKAMLQESGVTEGAFAPVTCHELTHKQNTPCSGGNHTCPMIRTFQTGQPAHDKHIRHKPDGDISYEDVFTYPIKNQAGDVQHVVHITRENTERKAAREEKRKLEERLDRSKKMEAIGLLAGGVAHDLNNVLSGIVSYPDLLLMDCPPEDKHMVESLEIIRESGIKASNIVMDLLTMARRGVMEMEVLSLNDIVQDYLQSPEYSKLQAYHPNVQVRFFPSNKLAYMKGSEIHLRKSIMNLVSNAAEAMPHGGEIHVATMNSQIEKNQAESKAMKPGVYVLLMITDTGLGINETDLTRIFEPFYTQKKMGRSGTGLGMAVVWGTVQDHKGYIDISSTPGKGTTFFLRFPITNEPLPASTEEVSLEDCYGNQESILVVEDIPQQQELANGILTKLGYKVRLANSGAQALKMIEQSPADLIVVDTVLGPEMDGLELLEKLRSGFPRQKAIITSGYFEPEIVERAQKAGVYEYLKKPYTIKSLGQAIRRELERNED